MSAPSLARALTIALPIPFAPPVTSALRPSSLGISPPSASRFVFDFSWLGRARIVPLRADDRNFLLAKFCSSPPRMSAPARLSIFRALQLEDTGGHGMGTQHGHVPERGAGTRRCARRSQGARFHARAVGPLLHGTACGSGRGGGQDRSAAGRRISSNRPVSGRSERFVRAREP